MNDEGLKKLQELAAEAADKVNTTGAKLASALPEPSFDPMQNAIEKLRAIEQAANPPTSPQPVVTMNRKQRRKAGLKAKRPSCDPAIHRYAETVRRMTDAQIWAEGHKEPTQQLVEEVARDVHEDILSVLAPHFDDHTMHRITDVLLDWYGIRHAYLFTDSNREANDRAYVPAPRVPGAAEPVVVGQVYKHFKGNYYRVTALAKMATALELEDSSMQHLDGMDVVVYQSTNPEHPDWYFVRPVSEFISATPDKYLKKSSTYQPYRFMLVTERTETNETTH